MTNSKRKTERKNENPDEKKIMETMAFPLDEMREVNNLVKASVSPETLSQYWQRVPTDRIKFIKSKMYPDAPDLTDFPSGEPEYTTAGAGGFISHLPYEYQKLAIEQLLWRQPTEDEFLSALDELQVPRELWEAFCRQERMDAIQGWFAENMGPY